MLPVIVTGPVTLLLLNSTPAVLFVSCTEPVIVFPAHGPVPASPPTTTGPVAAVDRQRAGEPAPADAHQFRARRLHRARDRRAVDEEEAALLHGDRPRDHRAGCDAHVLTGPDRQRLVTFARQPTEAGAAPSGSPPGPFANVSHVAFGPCCATPGFE